MAPAVRRALAVAIAVAVVTQVVFLVVGLLGRAPRGPDSSSFATGHNGASGLARLLERGGYDVEQRRVPVDLDPPAQNATVVVLGGSTPAKEEIAALRSFVAGGGRLVVAAGPDADGWTSAFVGGRMSRGDALLACRPLAIAPEVAGVADVEAAGMPGFSFTAGAVPVLGCRGTTLAAVAALGRGRVVVISDPAVFQNRLLAVRDNAAFATAVMGGVNRPIVFLEHLHGFDAPSGLAALPARWWLAGAVLVVAGALFAISRRPATSVRSVEPGPPPRGQHADAVAARLAASDASEAGAIARAAAMAALRRATRLGDTATAEDWRAAAARLGLPVEDVVAVVSGPADKAAAPAARVIAACANARQFVPGGSR